MSRRNARKGELVAALLEEIPENSKWQAIVIGRQEVWDVHRRTASWVAHAPVLKTLSIYPGERTRGNGELIENLVRIARECGREIASPEEARAAFI